MDFFTAPLPWLGVHVPRFSHLLVFRGFRVRLWCFQFTSIVKDFCKHIDLALNKRWLGWPTRLEGNSNVLQLQNTTSFHDYRQKYMQLNLSMTINMAIFLLGIKHEIFIQSTVSKSLFLCILCCKSLCSFFIDQISAFSKILDCTSLRQKSFQSLPQNQKALRLTCSAPVIPLRLMLQQQDGDRRIYL